MSLTDQIFIDMCRDILENGTSTEGQKVRMNIRGFMVFEDNGLLEQMLRIQT